MSFWQPKIYIPVVHFIDILQAAFAPIFFSQKLQRQTLSRENLRTALLFEKGAHKMLLKLTPGFDLRSRQNIDLVIEEEELEEQLLILSIHFNFNVSLERRLAHYHDRFKLQIICLFVCLRLSKKSKGVLFKTSRGLKHATRGPHAASEPSKIDIYC